MKKKPRFKRQNFLLKKLKNVWRKPRGIHSKLRLKKRGKGRRPKIGYGNKKNIRGLIKDQEYTYVSSMKDIDNAEKILLISSNIGARKKMQIIEKAMNLGLKVININAEKFLEDMKNKKEEKCLPLKERAKVLVFEGKHTGENGVVEKINPDHKMVEINSHGKKINVLIKQIIVTGE